MSDAIAHSVDEATTIFAHWPLPPKVLCVDVPRATWVTNLSDAMSFFAASAPMPGERTEANWPTPTDVDAICEGADRVVVLIMPRDVGRVPGAPTGHSAVLKRAHVAAEWADGAFHVFQYPKRKS